MSDSSASQLSEAMNRLWQKYLPQMEERVATLQAAAAQMASGVALSDEQHRMASADAHKLAGVLGTFGLKDGTELAREAENLYSEPSGADAATAERLATIAERLKTMIAKRA
jgi:HPt (histidine-containing phosphotransfer) domain-containing protein